MIINIFLKNKIDYKNIEDYSNLGLLVASLLTIINVYYIKQYFANVLFLVFYMSIDSLFTPLKKMDMLIHHMLSLNSLLYVLCFTDLNNNLYSSNLMLKTEWSSIFLGLNYFLKKYKMNKILLKISSVAFLITFLKYRLYDFYNNVVMNNYFTDSLLFENYEYNNYLLVPINITKYGFIYLNLYWLSLIIKSLYKSLKINIRLISSENILQYSYFLCLFSTLFSYAFIATNNQKAYYSDYIAMDATINLLLSMSSFKFHEYIYNNMLLDSNLNRSEEEYKNVLVQDVFVIQMRAIVQFYAHLKMHNIFENYKNLFYCQFASCLIVPIITNKIYVHLINNKIKYPINEVNNLTIFLDLLLGVNPFLCILYSILGVLNTNNAVNLLLVLYISVLIMIIKPFYNINHLMVHISFIFINYHLANNNLKDLEVV